jgi:hypothetical protein
LTRINKGKEKSSPLLHYDTYEETAQSRRSVCLPPMTYANPRVAAFGEDGLSADVLQERFRSIYDEPHIVIDLRGRKAVDVAFLSDLAQLRVHRNARGLMPGRLVVDTPKLRESLRAVGFDQHWAVFETLNAAVDSFDGPPVYA